MVAVPAFDLGPDGRPLFSTVYVRCPRCGVIAPPGSGEYRVARDGEMVPGPFKVSCAFDGHWHEVSPAEILPRDAVATCQRPGCGTTFPVPSAADQIACTVCRLHQDGPGLGAGGRRDQVRAVYRAHAADQRARLGHR